MRLMSCRNRFATILYLQVKVEYLHYIFFFITSLFCICRSYQWLLFFFNSACVFGCGFACIYWRVLIKQEMQDKLQDNLLTERGYFTNFGNPGCSCDLCQHDLLVFLIFLSTSFLVDLAGWEDILLWEVQDRPHGGVFDFTTLICLCEPQACCSWYGLFAIMIPLLRLFEMRLLFFWYSREAIICATYKILIGFYLTRK